MNNCLKWVFAGKNIVDAAKAVGVKHVVFSSLEDTRPFLDASKYPPITGPYIVPHFDAKSEVEAYLKAELPDGWTCIYPSVFLQNLLPEENMAPQKQEDGSYLFFIPAGGAKWAWCSTEDIGGVAAAVIAQGIEKWGGKKIGVAGDVVTMSELAAALAELTGKSVNVVEPPAEAWVQAVMGFGMPELAAKDLAHMFKYYEIGNEEFLRLRPLEQTKEVYPEVQSLDAWLQKNKERFIAGMP